MANNISTSENHESEISGTVQSSNLVEFQEMIDVALNLELPSDGNSNEVSTDESNINHALLFVNYCDDSQASCELTVDTSVSVAQLPEHVADNFNVAVKRLSLFCESVGNGTTEILDESTEENDEFQDETNSGPFAMLSAVPKTPVQVINNDNKPKKRHIMISYNHSSRETCRKIYNGLVERNYKVWMDMTDMGDNVLSSMARAVENSYIVLICINQQYYESNYCRLEAEYAAENKVKFIPCLMEKSFRPESWLGIIKGSNVHIDFSEPNEFDQSFEELVRQITHVEKRLSMQPRRTPAPTSMANPMKLAAIASDPTPTSTPASAVNSRRFDAIIREYKQSIRKQRHSLNQLQRSELSDLIVKLRQELFSETSQVLSDSEKSEDEGLKQNDENQRFEQLLNRTLDQNDLLLRLVDRLATSHSLEHNSLQNLDMNGLFKVILAIMLLWTLTILHQQEKSSFN